MVEKKLFSSEHNSILSWYILCILIRFDSIIASKKIQSKFSTTSKNTMCTHEGINLMLGH
jgi:hypothetical protein